MKDTRILKVTHIAWIAEILLIVEVSFREVQTDLTGAIENIAIETDMIIVMTDTEIVLIMRGNAMTEEIGMIEVNIAEAMNWFSLVLVEWAVTISIWKRILCRQT